jgi:hypothetical protein
MDICAGRIAQRRATTILHQIEAADIFVGLIQLVHLSCWRTWRIRATREAGKGLVGVLLEEYLDQPAEMCGLGAVFIHFKKEKLEAAVAFAAEGNQDRTKDYLLEDE